MTSKPSALRTLFPLWLVLALVEAVLVATMIHSGSKEQFVYSLLLLGTGFLLGHLVLRLLLTRRRDPGPAHSATPPPRGVYFAIATSAGIAGMAVARLVDLEGDSQLWAAQGLIGLMLGASVTVAARWNSRLKS